MHERHPNARPAHFGFRSRSPGVSCFRDTPPGPASGRGHWSDAPRSGRRKAFGGARPHSQ
ncbi:hypothetical protein GCM10010232_08980 [Streptomyces amakusaensis]